MAQEELAMGATSSPSAEGGDPPDPEIEAAWRQWLIARNRRGARTVLWLVAIFYPLFGILDYLVAPHEWLPLLYGSRAFVTAYTLGMFALVRTRLFERHSTILTSIYVLVLAGGIEVMIFVLGGYTSPYYAGLNLVMITAGLLFLWPMKVAITTHTLILLTFLVSNAFIVTRGQIVAAVTNFFFMGTTAVIVIAAQTLGYRSQREQVIGQITLERLKGQLEGAYERLKTLDAAKNHFFANLTHEFRTPLTLTIAPIEDLLDREDLSPAERQGLEVARRNALRLLRMVDDLLELTRLEAARLRLRVAPLSVARLVRDLVTRSIPLAQRKDITLSCEIVEGGEIEVEADAAQVERIILNLLANAIKFTEPGGKIDVRVAPADDGIEVSVTDTGIGIPAAELPRIFDRFHQVDPSGTRRHGGSGIGLALVKELVELHGGTVSAESRLGEGTTIRFRLPRRCKAPEHAIERRSKSDLVPVERRSREEGLPEWHESLRKSDEYRLLSIENAAERRIAPRPPRRSRLPTILVVEDNADMVQLLVGILSGEYEVLAATDGTSGLELARTQKPDLIVSDVMMPGMTGFDLVREIRRDPEIAQIPVILLTALGEVEHRIEGVSRGADAYLTKPFQPKELRSIVAAHLKREARRLEGVREEREVALRVLSEGIAHEILNPLGFIKNALFAFRESLEEACALIGEERAEVSALREDATMLYEAGTEGITRIQRAVEDLRRFSRGEGALPPERTEVRDIVEGVLRLLRGDERLHGVQTRLSSTRPVAVRPGHIEQVLLNLLLNAFHAAGAKGRIELETWDEAGEGGEPVVAISVTDNGPGIAPEMQEKIFYPFYTTKGEGEGRGLGLALARQIIREHGGTLSLTSESGKGSRFTIRLPAVAEDAAPEAG